MTRWALPILVVWVQLMFSAFVYQRRLPGGVRENPSTLLLVLLLLAPAVSTVSIWVARRFDRPPELRNSANDAVLLWFLAFLFSVHAVVLSVVVGMVPSLQPGLGWAVGGLMLGLGLLLPRLPPGSPFGLRTRLNLNSEAAWTEAHRRLGWASTATGVLSVLGASVMPSHPAVVVCGAPVAWVLVREGLRSASGLRETEPEGAESDVGDPEGPEGAT